MKDLSIDFISTMINTKGLDDSDVVVEYKPQSPDLDIKLREMGWKGFYIPIGSQMSELYSKRPAWFVVNCALEQTLSPHAVVSVMKNHSSKGIVLAATNPEVVDYGIQPLYQETLESWGFMVDPITVRETDDTLFALWLSPLSRAGTAIPEVQNVA